MEVSTNQVPWFLKKRLMRAVVTLAEVAAKFTIGSSVANSVRPRKYYKIPKESLESALDDVEQFINFFVIEAQRVVFAENIPNTALVSDVFSCDGLQLTCVQAFVASFLSYYLVKLLPAWGFALFATSVTFLVPLVYTQNKELIDSQLEHASNVVSAQTQQIRDVTADTASKSFESVKGYTNEYAGAASEYIGKSRQKIPMPAGTNGSTGSSIKKEDFPEAPQNAFASSAEHTKPIMTPAGDREPIAASNY